MADEKNDTPKYGIQDLADALGIAPASARVRLRNEGIEKSGRSYGWNTKSELDALVKQLKAKPEKEPKAEAAPKATGKADAKPAAKKVTKKAA